ncbi:hypothetical protein [uncultured Microbulbifer sp.]|uniref:hypothetical protein n=1 Tax=uncultured Microbulbifer sp. TaxID=348147 RepID=UPI002609BD4E|nr:hypothetical protein [uncultured Microbulbifer sp.]
MQEAVDTQIAGKAPTGSEAGHPEPRATSPRHASPASTSSARPSTTSTTAPSSLLERLSPAVLDLPALTCGCHSPRQLKRWISSYLQQNPLADKAQRNAGTLRSLLTEITRWKVPAGTRLASLEILRPVVVAHCQQLIQPLLIQARETPAFAQTQEQRRDLLTGIILFQHLALAYTSVCVQLASAPQNLLTRRRLAIALQRGIDGYRRLIFTSSLFFLASPKGSWGRIQRLLQLARKQHLDQRRVSDPLASSITDLLAGGFRWGRIAQAYLQTALFASANPMQLDTREQLQLWHFCRHWSGKTRLLDGPQDGTPGLLASIRLDQPPIPAIRLQRSRVDMKHFSAPQGWVLDLTHPLQHLQQRLRRSKEASTDLLQRVQDIWAGEKSRGGQRTPVNIRCQMVIGISAICHHLKHGDEPAPEIEATFSSHEAARDLVMDVDSIDFRSGRTLGSYEVSASDTSSVSSSSCLLPDAPSVSRNRGVKTARQRYQPIPATLLNTSNGGAGLRLPSNIQERLRCGELVALWSKGHWEVALIRWQFALPDQCRAGVEFLGGHTSAVLVHRHTRGGRRTDPMAGLLTGDAGLPPELVLPIPLFQTGDTVDIVSAGQARTVTLHTQSLATGSLAIFEFS